MPKTCDLIYNMIKNGMKFSIIGLTVLTEGASLDVHTDLVGPHYGDMACNMLLQGQGTLSIEKD